MAKMVYMVVEHFKGGDAVPVYRRFRDRGRLAPPGLTYVSSWVDTKLERCYQLMERDDSQLLHDWMAQWNDLVDFEVYPVITSAAAADAARSNRRPRTPGAVAVNATTRPRASRENFMTPSILLLNASSNTGGRSMSARVGTRRIRLESRATIVYVPSTSSLVSIPSNACSSAFDGVHGAIARETLGFGPSPVTWISCGLPSVGGTNSMTTAVPVMANRLVAVGVSSNSAPSLALANSVPSRRDIRPTESLATSR